MSINWENSYSVGISLIDEQHKKFFLILDELSSSIYSLKGTSVLDRIFTELYDYTKYHFDTEERYFAEFSYEGAVPHIAEHKNFIKRLTEIQTKMSEDKMKTALDLIDFMENWMVHHIDIMDKGYVECFREHGLK